MKLEMDERWWRLCRQVGARGDTLRELILLTNCYREPWRAYHTASHIETMLIEFDRFRRSEESGNVNPEVVEMCTWNHDAVYHPEEKDNEEKSVLFFKAAAARMQA